MTVRQITLNEVDDPCRICKRIDMDDPVPEGCPLLVAVMGDRILTDGMECVTEVINRMV
jgi:hypothetical protein